MRVVSATCHVEGLWANSPRGGRKALAAVGRACSLPPAYGPLMQLGTVMLNEPLFKLPATFPIY